MSGTGMAAFAGLLLATTAHAAGIEVSIDRKEVTVEDQLQLTVQVQGSQQAAPELPPLPNFDVVSSGRSTQMQIINGQTSTSVAYRYTLIPKRAGTFSIGAVVVRIDGRVYQSAPFTVRILSPQQQPKATRDAFVSAKLSQERAFVGEQVVYVFRFFRRVDIRDASLEMPDFAGFTVQDLGAQKDYNTTLDGQQFAVTEIRKALFPQEAGSLEIAPASLSVGLIRRSRRSPRGFRSPFDDFFGGAHKETKTLRSPPVSLEVAALPPAPKGFSGLVGDFRINAQLSQTDLSVGESTTLTVTIHGSGNAQSIVAPIMDPLDGFKVYDDKPTATLNTDGPRVQGSRSFRRALVPLRPGTLTIAPIVLSTFDPTSGVYRTQRTRRFDLDVAPGKATEDLRLTEARAPLGGKMAVQVLADDILPPHLGLDAVQRRPRLQSPWVIGSFLSPPLGFALLLLRQRRKSARAGSMAQRRRRGALRKGLRAAAQLQRSAADAGASETSQQASRVLRAYVGDKLTCEGSTLTAADIQTLLRSRGLDDTAVAQTQAFLAACDAHQYGATHDGSAQEVPTQLHRLLLQLDRALGATR